MKKSLSDRSIKNPVFLLGLSPETLADKAVKNSIFIQSKDLIVSNCGFKIFVTHLRLNEHERGNPFKLGLVADLVFEAIARLEFEDGLRTGVLL